MKPSLRTQKGQVTIEAVLLITIMLGVSTFAHKAISSRGLLSQLVSGPWSYVAGMISNGVWKGGDSSSLHPNRFQRRASPRPE